VKAGRDRLSAPGKSGWAHARAGSEPNAAAAASLLRRTHQAASGMLLLAIAGIWLAAAIHGILAGKPAIVAGLGASGAYWAGAIGAVLAVIALHWIVRCETVAIGHGVVRASKRSLFGTRGWREPLANYRGLRGRHENRPHRYGPRRWYVVELWHPEPSKVVELARTKTPGSTEARTQAWASRFRLPPAWARHGFTAPSDSGLARFGPRFARHRPPA
jgi:hypothetical protein